jgi:nucleoid-associated protein YgaU
VTREHKLALIVGFSLILLVGVLISDHLSRARQAKIASVGTSETGSVVVPPAAGDPMKPLNDALATEPPKALAGAPASSGPATSNAKKEPEPLIVAQGPAKQHLETPESALDRAIRDQQGTLVQRPDGSFDIRLPAAQQSNPESIGSPLGGAIVNTTPKTSPLPKFEDEKSAKPNTIIATNDPVKYHAVKKGETMFQIASDYYGTGKIWRELAKFNGVESKEGAVRVGTKLKIPNKDVLLGKATPSKATVEAPAAPAAKPAPGKRQEGTPIKPKIELATYTVKKGDTLGDISQKTLGTSKRWHEFVELNRIEDEDHIPAGTVLKVPVMRG